MPKFKITENNLRNLISESIRNVLTELDWKTIQNVADTRGRGIMRTINNQNSAIDRFNEQHGIQKHTSQNNLVWIKRTAPNPQLLSLGFENTSTKGLHDGIFRYGQAYIGHSGEWEIYSQSDHKKMTPDEFFENDTEAINTYQKAISEIDHYNNGNYEYNQGWKLKDE